MKILIESNPIALWRDIIHDAEVNCEIVLRDDLESYLVFLLARCCNKPDIIKHIIAPDFLASLKLSANQREIALQNVGDKCLLFSGLFPKIAEKRLVKISYFVNIGQAAYENISKKRSDTYHALANQFVSLMDILQSIKDITQQHPALLPMQAYDLWNETGSKRALKILNHYTDGHPHPMKDNQ